MCRSVAAAMIRPGIYGMLHLEGVISFRQYADNIDGCIHLLGEKKDALHILHSGPYLMMERRADQPKTCEMMHRYASQQINHPVYKVQCCMLYSIIRKYLCLYIASKDASL